MGKRDEMTTDEVAAELGVQPGTVRQWLRRGKLTSRRKVGTGRHAPHLFDPAEVARLKTERAREQEQEQAEAQIRAAVPAVAR